MNNFGFEFNRTSEPEFSDFMNQKIYEKILWDKIKLLENPALNPNAKPNAKKDVDDLDFTINLRPDEGVRQLMKGLDNYLHLINKD